jgi:hypothetical protein
MGIDQVFIMVAAIAAVGGSWYVLRRVGDARNIARLRDRYDLEPEEAERMYRLSRRIGFGFAYRQVLGDRRRTRPVRDAARPVLHKAPSDNPPSSP